MKHTLQISHWLKSLGNQRPTWNIKIFWKAQAKTVEWSLILLLLSKCLLKTQILLAHSPLYLQDPEPTDISCFENFLAPCLPPFLSTLQACSEQPEWSFENKGTCPCSSQNYPRTSHLLPDKSQKVLSPSGCAWPSPAASAIQLLLLHSWLRLLLRALSHPTSMAVR